MEWQSDVFRMLALVIVWAIPAVLIVAVAVFAILAPALPAAGAVFRVYEAIRDRLRRRAGLAEKEAAGREPVGRKA